MANPRPHRAMTVAAALLVAGCTAGEAPGVPAGDAELVTGREVYISSCANCHGSSGQGGRGSKLDDGRVVERYPDPAEEIDLVTNGVRAMPDFGSKLSAAEIEAVVRYTREILAAG